MVSCDVENNTRVSSPIPNLRRRLFGMNDEYGHRMKHPLPVAAIVVLATIGAAGQSRPDFSGRWSMDLARSEAAAQGPPIGPVEVAITQTADELQIATTRNGNTETVRYLPAE